MKCLHVFVLLVLASWRVHAEPLEFPAGSSYRLGKHVTWIELLPGDPHYHENKPGPWLETYPRIQGQDDTLRFGYTRKKFWFEIDIHNPTFQEQTAILEIGTAWLDSLTLFTGEGMQEIQESGDLVPHAQWPLPYRLPSFKFILKPGETKKSWLRVQSLDALIVPLKIWDEKALAPWERNRNIQEGIYIGLIGTICFINASIFFFTLRPAFLAYASYLGFYLLTQMSLDGIIGIFCPSLPPWFINRLYACFNTCTVSFASLFTVKFLSLSKYSPRLARFASFSAMLFLLFAGCTLLLPVNTIPLITSILYAAFFAPIALISAARAMPHEPRSAKFFMIAWFPVVFCVTLLAMSFLNIIQADIDSRGLLLIGIALEAVIFSLALGDQLARSIRENARAKINLESAEAVQKALIPSLPAIPGCALHGWYKAADTTGGDWYDVIYDAKRDIVYCFIGDVTGHGISSTLVSSTVSGTVHGVMEQQIKAGREWRDALWAVAASVNRAVKRTGSESGRLLTLNLIALDLKKREGVLLNAGHCHPLIFRQDKILALASHGSILGMEEEIQIMEKTFQLKDHDILFLYSDGLIHTHSNGKVDLKINRLAKQISGSSSASEVVERARQIWMQNYSAWPLEDDCSLLAIEISGSR